MTNIFKKLYQSVSGGAEQILATTYGPKGIHRYLRPSREDLKDQEALLGPIDLSPQTLTLYENAPDPAPGAAPETDGPIGPQGALEGDPGLVLMEPFSPKPRLIVFGGGHVSLALAPMAAMMDFELIIYDDRPAFS
ncbi:MAG: XdhC family protein, partial [Deltaproteobacteria bacterium]|nr:XdhC family protein [Deltaproteobacteria bacterium]